MAATSEVAGGRAFPRLQWSAVLAGVALALAAHIVLGLIGAALGFAARPSDSRAVGIAAVVWGLVTPFVATLLGAWLACRMTDTEDTRSGWVHGILVWSLGLIAGALFLTGTMATGAMSAGTAASGNLGAAERSAREAGNRPTGQRAQARAERGADEAAKGAAAGAGGGALAAIAGLLGAVVGAGLTRRREGAARGRWRTAFRHDETRAGPGGAGDRGYGTTYGSTGSAPPREGEGPPTDPYQH